MGMGKGNKPGGSSLETSLGSRGRTRMPAEGLNLQCWGGSQPQAGGQRGLSEPLTTPKSAKPEPMLIMVGMMSNFPACRWWEKKKL